MGTPGRGVHHPRAAALPGATARRRRPHADKRSGLVAPGHSRRSNATIVVVKARPPSSYCAPILHIASPETPPHTFPESGIERIVTKSKAVLYPRPSDRRNSAPGSRRTPAGRGARGGRGRGWHHAEPCPSRYFSPNREVPVGARHEVVPHPRETVAELARSRYLTLPRD